ncbi:hypothetical protein C8J56DRAFT_954356 [Mycena floridula]|nr:hypothetical protein C8J56DRAFT_954356 [Mycena floridula]
MTLDPTTPSASQYWLKVRAVDSSSPGLFNGFYLRLHGGGINDVVLTEAPPKFLRWQEESGAEIATSTTHRRFGLVLSPLREKRGWESAMVVENESDRGFVWKKTEIEGRQVETLGWNGDEDGGKSGFQGFIAAQWDLGHPQLFWITGQVDKPLPAHCERIFILREWLIKREEV